MTQSSPNPRTLLRQCINLVQEVSSHPQANQEFAQLRDSIAATRNVCIAIVKKVNRTFWCQLLPTMLPWHT